MINMTRFYILLYTELTPQKKNRRMKLALSPSSFHPGNKRRIATCRKNICSYFINSISNLHNSIVFKMHYTENETKN